MTYPIITHSTQVVAADEERNELPVTVIVDVAHAEVGILHLGDDVGGLVGHAAVGGARLSHVQL